MRSFTTQQASIVFSLVNQIRIDTNQPLLHEFPKKFFWIKKEVIREVLSWVIAVDAKLINHSCISHHSEFLILNIACDGSKWCYHFRNSACQTNLKWILFSQINMLRPNKSIVYAFHDITCYFYIYVILYVFFFFLMT